MFRKTICKIRDRIPAGWMPRKIGGAYEYPPSVVFLAVRTLFNRLNEYQSVTAMVLLPGTVFLWSYTTLAQLSPARGAVLLLILLQITDFVFGWIFRPKMKIVRHLPERIQAFSTFQVTYRLTNLRRFPAWNLEVDPGLGMRYFQFQNRGVLPEIPGKGNADANLKLTAPRRGRYSLGYPRVMSRFPFGLTQWLCRSGKRMTLTVFPDYSPLQKLVLPNGKRFQSAGLNRLSKISEAADFRGCRDFRSGDNPRHIHWPASARHGNLVVKEFQEEYLHHVAIVLDTGVPGYRAGRSKALQNSLEAELSLAAAASEFLLGGEALIELFIAGEQVRHLQSGRGTAPLEAVLDLLAETEPEEPATLPNLHGTIRKQIRELGGVLVFLLGADEARRNLIRELEAGDGAVKVILIAEKAPPDLPKNWRLISPRSIQNHEFTEL